MTSFVCTRDLHRLLILGALLGALALPSTAGAASTLDPAARVLELTNNERAAAGLAPLQANPHLIQAAQSYAQVLATGECFAHTCGPVPELPHRIEQAGFTGWTVAAENIAAGQQTPEAVVTSWMNSEGHRQNILNPELTELGVGVANGEGQFGVYWAQVFGTRAVAEAPWEAMLAEHLLAEAMWAWE